MLATRTRVILQLEHLKFFNHTSIGILVKSPLQVRQTFNCSYCTAQQIVTATRWDSNNGIWIKYTYMFFFLLFRSI